MTNHKKNKMEVKDSNGNLLKDGDSVILTRSLKVKGVQGGIKKGQKVKNIRLSEDDPTHIEGKVNKVSLFIKTEYLKKV